MGQAGITTGGSVSSLVGEGVFTSIVYAPLLYVRTVAPPCPALLYPPRVNGRAMRLFR
jgi:hypothetical protein